MAVASLLTSLENFESAPTYTNIGSGGGATDNTDVFIEGAQSGGRRVDNATAKGFMGAFTSADLSAAGEHVKFWLYCFHWSAVTSLTSRIASGTTAYDNHTYPIADIPVLGGWIPIWVDVSRTPDSTGTSGLNEAAVTDVGAYVNINNVGGAGDNFILDEIMHGTSGYRWTATGGDFGDFRTFESTNVEGVLIPSYQADLCFARLEIGSATATTFTDSGFTLLYPDQALVSSTFMGLTVDIQNASTAVDLSNGAIVSGDPVGATNRPDLLVTGTGGAFDLDTMLLNGLRTIELNQDCTLTNSTVLNTGVVDATSSGTTNGADLSGTAVVDSTVAADASAVVWDVNADPDTKTDGMSFVQGTNAHHAIELGTNVPATVNFTGLTSTGFDAADAANGSFFYVAKTLGTQTINVSASTGNFSYKSAGATVVVVVDPVALSVGVIDGVTKAGIQNAYVTAWCSDEGNGPYTYPTEVSVTIARSGTTATVTHTGHGLATDDVVRIDGATEPEYNGIFQITVTGANAYTYTVLGSPSQPATGSPTSSLVLINGLTDASGNISDTRAYGVDQDIAGRVNKGGTAPVYKAADIVGVVDSASGVTINVPMAAD